MHKYSIQYTALTGVAICLLLAVFAVSGEWSNTMLPLRFLPQSEKKVAFKVESSSEELVSFGATENPSFAVDTLTQGAPTLGASLLHSNTGTQDALPAVTLIGPRGNSVPVEYAIDDGVLTLDQAPGQRFMPGRYALVASITNAAGSTESVTKDFSWGVLAMNTDRDRYTIGQKAHIAFGVLDDEGKILCDADLSLVVTQPDGQQMTLSTHDQSIAVTGVCGKKVAYLIDPDYETFLQLDQRGTYKFDLSAKTSNGIRTTHSEISVAEKLPFSIQRTAATRLWPEAPSTMDIAITFAEDFTGTIRDSLPSGFVVEAVEPSAKISITSGNSTPGMVTWNGSWAAGSTVRFQYTYDAPDISPEFYLIGPLTLNSVAGETYTEARSWQIANDDTSTKNPSTVENDTSFAAGDVDWTNPTNAATNDDSYATADLDGGSCCDFTEYLKATNFGFDLPSGSTIGGVSVTIRKYYIELASGGTGEDQEVRLIVSGSGSINKSVGAVLDTAERADTYGSSSDHWGRTLTEAIIENSAFGVLYAAEGTGGNGDESRVLVDSFEITVTYTPPALEGTHTLTGIVYSDQGTTPIGASKTVNVGINGSYVSTAETDAGGMYQISNLTLTGGSVITIYLDGETEKAATVTLGSGSSMTGMHLYQSRVILRSDSGSVAMTNSFLATADNIADTDVTNLFSVTSGNLQIGADTELLVWSGDTFTPGGKVFTHDLEVLGTMTMSTNTLVASGSFVANAGTFSTSSGIFLKGTDDSEVLNVGTNAIGGNIIMNSGLVGYWKFDEASESIARDTSYYGYDGTINFGSGSWSTDTPSRIQFYNPHSLYFGAGTTTPTFVNMGSHYDQDGSKPFTLSAWINFPTAPTQYYFIISKTASSGNFEGYNLNVDSARKLSLNLVQVQSTNHLSVAATNAITAGSWTHVIATYNGNKGPTGVKLFLNGAKETNVTQTNNFTGTSTTSTKFQVGSRENGNYPFKGYIDDVRVYNRVLSDSEALALYNGNQGTGSGRYVLGANIDLNAGLKMYDSTLDVSSGNNYSINVAGDFANYGVLTKQSGTVTFDGTAQTISGSTVFHNFTKAVAAADTMYFDWKGRQSVSGALILNGATSQLLTLRSTNTGSGWNILLDGSSGTESNVSYLDVRDSDASGGQELDCLTLTEECINSGNNTNWFFVIYITGTGSVTGSVWEDTDGDGTLDGGETTGLNGVSVSISGQTSTGQTLSFPNQTTDVNGDYAFHDVVRSNSAGYTIALPGGVPSGYLKTGFTSSGGNILGTGGTLVVDFGFVRPSTISGAVFVDLDQDGVIDSGENDRLQNISLTISGTSASGNTVTDTQTSGVGGIYAFRNLGPSSGQYTVSVSSATVPSGYSAKLYTSSGMSIAAGNTHITSANFGYYWYGTMSGSVFLDSDGDGVQDPAETSGVSSVSINFIGESSTGATINRSTTTTSTGAFTFLGVPISSGSYTLSMTAPSGYSGSTVTSVTRTIGVGTHAQSTTFGLQPAIYVTGTVYSDQGVTSIGSNKIVSLSVNGAVATSSGTTDAGGQYTIESYNLTHGAVMTLYLDNHAEDAVTISIGSGSTMTGVHLYQNRLILRNQTGGVITNTHIDTANNGGDADITGSITSASSAAVVFNSAFEVLVWTGTTYAPGGTVTSGDLEVDGTFTAGGAIIGSGAVIDGTLTTGGNALTLNRLTASGTLTLGSSTVIVKGGWNTSDATFTTSGLIHLRGTGSSYTFAPGSSAFTHLTTSGSYTLASGLDVNGNYALSGGTLDVSASNYRITVSGDWHNAIGSGAFVAGSGTVVLDGYGSDQLVTGSTRFNKLTKTGSVAATITFDANRQQYFSGSLVLQGASSQLLKIRSTGSGTQAPIALIGSGTFRQDLDYLDVKDSNAGSGVLLYCLAIENGCFDGGNTTNWLLSADCGDGIIHSGETCDAGGSNSNAANAACRLDCTAQRCGDGIADSGEACDDGNSSNLDGCLNTCALPICGDGYIRTGTEECEPPNSATCQSNCLFRTAGGGSGGGTSSASSSTSYSRRPDPPDGCGNAILEVSKGEQCDAGRFNGLGTCSYDCKQLTCGDGLISPQIGEDCEPNKIPNPNGGQTTVFEVLTCGKICTVPELNVNGAAVGGCRTIFLEQCNAGSSSSDAFTPAGPICGNTIIETGEECDSQEGCSEMCSWNICGDGLINQQTEQCDNGSVCENDTNRACRTDIDCAGAPCIYNASKNPQCGADCVSALTIPPAPPTPRCGDGLLQSGEVCDDGNTESGDGCNSLCRVEQKPEPGAICGNASVETGEQCDAGEANSDTTPNACREDCRAAFCGDSIRDTAEECDEGARNTGTRANVCRLDCRLPRCGDGIIDANEFCDGGITCRSDCSGAYQIPCGNGKLEGAEECDDGNYRNGDGCSAACYRETQVEGASVRPAASPRPKVRPQQMQKVQPVKREGVRPAAPRAPRIPGSQMVPSASVLPIIQGRAPIGATGPAVPFVLISAAGAFVWSKKRKSKTISEGMYDTFDR